MLGMTEDTWSKRAVQKTTVAEAVDSLQDRIATRVPGADAKQRAVDDTTVATNRGRY